MITDIFCIIAVGQDLDWIDAQGATLLHIARANGYLRTAELLLDHGVRVDVKDWDGWEPLHTAAFWGQMQMAEMLVSHGASLRARTSMDEMPIDLCEGEEFKVLLLELKHKHDVIMKSQLRHKSSLSQRTSSAGSRGWLEKPMLLSKFSAKISQGELDGPIENGLRAPVSTYQYAPSNGDVWKVYEVPDYSMACSSPDTADTTQPWSGFKEQSPQTLLELKRQQAAAKLLSHPFLSTHLGSSMARSGESSSEGKAPLIGGRTSPYSSSGTLVYYTVTCGDPPLLKFKAPIEEMEEKVHGCCHI
ncbi:Protein phosphatase 1 regulatory inhibitor subunit 16B [Heterocephalus glaber]|uniref:Protein phosphatase 1 regulatory inhibitor subunit 16B n=1 Tax=Heterocephalus glaber TaxID=10181 RepID=G5BHF0_HETGA|nr:Protein phosphatase 1 regulatory inhibitor subunit 16B [Heterocephalus glaber]